MTVRASEQPRSATERRAETTLPVIHELEPRGRETKLKGEVHPSLRALPDYPAR